MNKRYMDFVPAAKTEAAEPKKTVTKKISTPKTSGAVARARNTRAVRRVDSVVRVKPAVQTKKVQRVATPPVKTTAEEPKPTKMSVATFTDEKKTKLGEVEDLSRRFVKTEVAKRPLSQPAPRPKNSLKEKFGSRQKKEVPKVMTEEKLVETYRMSNSPFINQGNIEKRPLSKTVYTKKVVVPKEKKQEPVTIITKPEKQSHIGAVIAVILTIILGAAAGTVAFLLLPK